MVVAVAFVAVAFVALLVAVAFVAVAFVALLVAVAFVALLVAAIIVVIVNGEGETTNDTTETPTPPTTNETTETYHRLPQPRPEHRGRGLQRGAARNLVHRSVRSRTTTRSPRSLGTNTPS